MLFGSQLKLLSSILTLCVYYFLARFLHYLADNCVQESSSLFQRVLRLLVDVLISLKALIKASDKCCSRHEQVSPTSHARVAQGLDGHEEPDTPLVHGYHKEVGLTN